MFSLCVTVAIFVLASAPIDAQTLFPTSTGSVGAVYTLSNGATKNQVLVQSLNMNGQMTMTGSVDTNGTGVNTTAEDVLFSQGSVVVYSNYLFVVNPGSNSISMFMISPSDGTQLTLVSVQTTNGWFPISIAVNSMYACVLTGGPITGIRCFTYNASGLMMVPSFDRNLTSYISQTVPPSGPPGTMSQISFSGDNMALIVAVKGDLSTKPGYVLIYPMTNSGSMLAANPVKSTPANASLLFSISLVGKNGMIFTDAALQGVITTSYSSTDGTTQGAVFTYINSTMASALCWSAYSPMLDNYYVVAAGSATIFELKVNLGSTTSPVTIVGSYTLPARTGALDATVVTLGSTDYLYVIGTTAHVVAGYKLGPSGNATALNVLTVQQGNVATIPKLAGVAGFVNMKSAPTTTPPSSGISMLASMLLIAFSVVLVINETRRNSDRFQRFIVDFHEPLSRFTVTRGDE